MARREFIRRETEVIRVLLPKRGLVGGQLGIDEDRAHRADRQARAAVDALGGIDVELGRGLEGVVARARVDAVHGADLDAGGVLDADAGGADDVRHDAQRTLFTSGGFKSARVTSGSACAA